MHCRAWVDNRVSTGLTGMISSQLELHRYNTSRESRVVSAMTLLKSHLFRQVVDLLMVYSWSFRVSFGSHIELPECTGTKGM